MTAVFQSVRLVPAPARWTKSCAHEECTLHQLSPYIGKIKSSIAGELVKKYSRPGDLVVDPFAGAGTIPFESALKGRRAFGADISPYAKILSLAKLYPPRSLEDALEKVEAALEEAKTLSIPDLRTVPVWVRQFFHPDTLREALNFSVIARRRGNEFLMACLLGILHHQRPGFLSFPSSHLVPYLRDKKYPRRKFPEMYAYRALKPRLLAKVERSYKRFNPPGKIVGEFSLAPVQQLELPERFDALISSPPYMNALDYGRDNRLRLWFIDQTNAERVDNDVTERRQAFIEAISSLGYKVESGLRRKGYCVLVVGEEVARRSESHPSEVLVEIFKNVAPSLRLKKVLTDNIPDIRRTRRECRGVKTEHILVFQRH